LLLSWATRLPIAYLLLSSAVAHLGNPYQFLITIGGYDLVPEAVGQILAGLLPFLHIAMALCLLFGYALRTVFAVGSCLFLTYGIAQFSAYLRGLEIACGCFGHSPTEIPIGMRSIALASAAAALCVCGWWTAAPSERFHLS
jgi:hypothetical protein